MIVLCVDFTVKAGTEERCKQLIRILTEQTRKEPGCVMYLGHQHTEEPRRFFFYEQYRDEAALAAHRESAHYAEHVNKGLAEIIDARSRELFVPVE